MKIQHWPKIAQNSGRVGADEGFGCHLGGGVKMGSEHIKELEVALTGAAQVADGRTQETAESRKTLKCEFVSWRCHGFRADDK